MPIPDFQSLMLPTLTALSDGAETPIRVVRERVADAEELTQDDMRELLPSGRQPVFNNRIGWALTYMQRAGLLDYARRGVYRLTDEGRRLLGREPAQIDISILRNYPRYVEWANIQAPDQGSTTTEEDESSDTPEETLDRAARRLRDELETEVLGRVREAEPAFLERVVVDLLIAMGYGGGDVAMGRVTGRSGDGGIDGTIWEDALGLDEVYVQAKKYAPGNAVGEGALRNFAGAIDAAGTTKGVFVTTSSFTASAWEYVRVSPKRIVLIDGPELARLLVSHDLFARRSFTKSNALAGSVRSHGVVPFTVKRIVTLQVQSPHLFVAHRPCRVAVLVQLRADPQAALRFSCADQVHHYFCRLTNGLPRQFSVMWQNIRCGSTCSCLAESDTPRCAALVASANFCNSTFHSRLRLLFEPPPSAVISNRRACIRHAAHRHHRRSVSTANTAVS